MAYNVMMLEGASNDLESIYWYLLRSANSTVALNEIERLEQACDSLTENPECGTIPHEVKPTGMFEYRQIIAKPYRIIYQISENNVFIFAVVHGRRNLQDVLRQRIIINSP
jgi:toxin ParE1/3/4